MSDADNAIAAAIASVRDEAIATFGWTHVELDARWDGMAWVLRGQVVAPRWRDRVVAAVVHAAGGAAVDASGVALLRSERVHALSEPCTTLRRGPELDAPLVGELVPEDGPVMWLATHEGGTLVRVRDGTLGWTRATLGAEVPLPRFAAPSVAPRPDRLGAAAAAWRDVPYHLGGATRAGIDCSALVQRMLRTVGIWLPRHSVDQVAIEPHDGPGPGSVGDLLGVWTADESPCHVALIVAPDVVAHASRSRGRVVIEPIDDLLARVGWAMHVPFAAFAALSMRVVGAFALDEVLALGRVGADALRGRHGSTDVRPRSAR